MKRLLMFAAVAFLFVACNKDQQAVKKLEGTWTATKIIQVDGGVTVDLLELGLITSWTVTFDKCKLKDDEFCNITNTVATILGSDSETGLYRVTGDGTKLEQKEDTSSETITTLEITELTNSTLKLRDTDEDGIVTEASFEK